MSVPPPPVALQDQCSVIRDDTLYVYSPSAFQALPLKKKAKWSQLSNGVPVTGAVCVLGLDSGPGSGDALWVVGGSPKRSTSRYPGLQKYSFNTKTWKTVTPITEVTANRRGHGAAYLKAAGSILLYGGSQESTEQKSIETFVIQTSSPFNVLSYTAQNTPTLSPVLLSWNDTAAITFGGDTSKEIYMFNQDNANGGWTPYGTSLPATLKSTNDQQATLVKGTDGSKVLELYDMSVSPNRVSGIVLQDANGNAAQTGQLVGLSSEDDGRRKRKRGLTLNDWPSYDDTNAPSFKRSGFSIAQNSDSGVTAMVGGNDQHPLSLFNEQRNSWVDNSKFFGDTKTVSAEATSLSATSTSTTTSATSTPTPPPAVADHPKTSIILGATLGSLCGLILILVIILLCLRYRRRDKRQDKAKAEENEKRRLSFADRGDPFAMQEDKSAKRQSRNLTHSAIAVVDNKSKAGHARRSDSKGSDSSTRRLVPKHDPLARHGENVEMTGLGPGVPPVPAIVTPDGNDKSNSSTPYTLPKRSSGWSRYFSGAPSANPSMVPAGSAAVAKTPGHTGSMLSSNSSSSHDCSSHGPTEIPPLQLGQEFNGGRISKVVTGSPPSTSAGDVKRTATLTSVVPSSRDSRPWTVSSMNSSGRASSIDEAIFTGQQHSDNNRWTPVDRSNWTGPTLRDTVTSSVYTHTPKNSETLPTGLNTIIEQNDGSTPRHPPRISDPDTWPRPPKSLVIPEEDSAPGVQEIMRPSYPHDEEEEEPSTPTATTAIPIPASTAMQYTVKKPSKPVTNSDLSWLNLGPVQQAR